MLRYVHSPFANITREKPCKHENYESEREREAENKTRQSTWETGNVSMTRSLACRHTTTCKTGVYKHGVTGDSQNLKR